MRMNYGFFSALIIFFHLIVPLKLQADERGIRISSLQNSKASDQNRIALLIGNGAYEYSPLKNPANDALDVEAALKKIGFKVTCKIDVGKREMEDAIRRFGKDLTKGGAGLFFYAGHGMQVKGTNYLIPVRAAIEKESDIRYEAVDAGRILAEMEHAGNGLNIVILDACRDNPFARSFRSGRKGLARMDAPAGTYIAYSTAPDSVAHDGGGRNSVFTSHLLQTIMKPGLPIEQVMKQVRINVMHDTANGQVPWDASSLTGDFYFIQGETSGAQTAIESLSNSRVIARPNSEEDVFLDDGAEIWDLPEILPPVARAESKTVVRSASAVGKTTNEACAKAMTQVARLFFNGRPSDRLFQQSVYRMYCNVVKRLQKDNVRVEVSIEFYEKE